MSIAPKQNERFDCESDFAFEEPSSEMRPAMSSQSIFNRLVPETKSPPVFATVHQLHKKDSNLVLHSRVAKEDDGAHIGLESLHRQTRLKRSVPPQDLVPDGMTDAGEDTSEEDQDEAAECAIPTYALESWIRAYMRHLPENPRVSHLRGVEAAAKLRIILEQELEARYQFGRTVDDALETPANSNESVALNTDQFRAGLLDGLAGVHKEPPSVIQESLPVPLNERKRHIIITIMVLSNIVVLSLIVGRMFLH